jgi:hypothetical protein
MRHRQRLSTPRALAYAGLAALTLLIGLPARPPAVAAIATPLGGSFSITPARRYVTGRLPLTLAATRVANTTQSVLDVRVVPVLLTQLPSGAFAYQLSSQALRAAQRVLTVSQRSFVLAPAGSNAVLLRWRRLPRGARTAAVGVIYQATPAAGGTPVRIVEQLLAVNILRLPGAYRSSGQLAAVHVSQAKPRTLRFVLDVRNSGQAVAGPSRLVLTIHGGGGRRLLIRQLTPDIVLPGATREFTLNLAHQLPAGSYTTIGHMAFGSSHDLSAEASFQLVAPNELPTSQLRLGPLTAQGTVDHDAHIAAQAQNTGNAPGALHVRLALYRLSGGAQATWPIATRTVTTQTLAPGAKHELREQLGRLRPGTYELLASYRTDGSPQTLAADFQAQRPLDLLAELRSVSREHALLLPGLLLLVCGAACARAPAPRGDARRSAPARRARACLIAERPARQKPERTGQHPAPRRYDGERHADVAQLAEHRFCKPGVAGSIPAVGSRAGEA